MASGWSESEVRVTCHFPPKYSLQLSGLELAAVQLGHKRMTTTDEHYNDRDMDDLKRAAELIEGAFWKDFAPEG